MIYKGLGTLEEDFGLVELIKTGCGHIGILKITENPVRKYFELDKGISLIFNYADIFQSAEGLAEINKVHFSSVIWNSFDQENFVRKKD